MSYGYRPKEYVIIEKAPWTPGTCAELNKYQNSCKEGESRYTCPNHGKDNKPKLVASSTGWSCPLANCSHKQDFYYGESLII